MTTPKQRRYRPRKSVRMNKDEGSWVRRLNDNSDPYTPKEVALLSVFFFAWLISIYLIWEVSVEWPVIVDRLPTVNLFPLVVSYLWFGFGGILGTWSFVEAIRRLYSSDWLLLKLKDGTRQPPVVRLAPRIEPMVTGGIERALLTTVGIMILMAAMQQAPPIGALGAVGAGYVVLKSVKRFTTSHTGNSIPASIYSIWGSSVSVAFAFLGSWWFLQYHLLITTAP